MIKIKNKRRVLIISAIVFLNFLCDNITKYIARNAIDAGESIELVSGSVILMKAENAGAAFGIGSNFTSDLKTFYFQLLPVFFLVYMFRMIILETDFSKLITVGIAFAVGGGFGNIYDRIAYGSVTDFIVLDMGVFKTPVFNIADVSIILGLILVFVDIFKKGIEELKNEVIKNPAN